MDSKLSENDIKTIIREETRILLNFLKEGICTAQKIKEAKAKCSLLIEGVEWPQGMPEKDKVKTVAVLLGNFDALMSSLPIETTPEAVTQPIKKSEAPPKTAVILEDRNYFDTDYQNAVQKFGVGKGSQEIRENYIRGIQAGMKVLARGTLHLFALHSALEGLAQNGETNAKKAIREAFYFTATAKVKPENRTGVLSQREASLKLFFENAQDVLEAFGVNLAEEIKLTNSPRKDLPQLGKQWESPIMICRACRDLLDNVFQTVLEDMRDGSSKTFQWAQDRGLLTKKSPWELLKNRSTTFLNDLDSKLISSLRKQYLAIEKKLIEFPKEPRATQGRDATGFRDRDPSLEAKHDY